MKKLIPFVNLKIKSDYYKSQILEVLSEVIDSHNYILADFVHKFEAEFASFVGARYCIAVANGTDAIEIALRSLGIKSGDTVLTVANAGMYATNAILNVGAKPLFVDVELDSSLISIQHLKDLIENNFVKGVVVTHLYGLCIPNILEIKQLCREREIVLLEDCAQAHGAGIEAGMCGTFGDAASFSFYPTKNLGAIGDAGAVVTNIEAVSEISRSLRQYGWESKYYSKNPGGRNSRMDEVQAAVLSLYLPHLKDMNERRRSIAKQYSNRLSSAGILTPPVKGADFVAHLYTVRVSNREKFIDYVFSRGIQTSIHYPVPDHKQSSLERDFREIVLPNTEILAREILSIPCYPELGSDDLDYIIETINQFEP